MVGRPYSEEYRKRVLEGRDLKTAYILSPVDLKHTSRREREKVRRKLPASPQASESFFRHPRAPLITPEFYPQIATLRPKPLP
jgi:hypothetical protein